MPTSRRILLVCFILITGTTHAWGQEVSPEEVLPPAPRYFQLGLGLLPGAGIQTGYVVPNGMITLEGAFYARIKPDFSEGQGDFLLTFGLGSALRISRALIDFDLIEPLAYDVDFGARLGPSFVIPYNHPEPIDRTRVFSLFFEPFTRVSRAYQNGWTVYAEIGLQSPIIRGGLLLGI